MYPRVTALAFASLVLLTGCPALPYEVDVETHLSAELQAELAPRYPLVLSVAQSSASPRAWVLCEPQSQDLLVETRMELQTWQGVQADVYPLGQEFARCQANSDNHPLAYVPGWNDSFASLATGLGWVEVVDPTRRLGQVSIFLGATLTDELPPETEYPTPAEEPPAETEYPTPADEEPPPPTDTTTPPPDDGSTGCGCSCGAGGTCGAGGSADGSTGGGTTTTEPPLTEAEPPPADTEPPPGDEPDVVDPEPVPPVEDTGWSDDTGWADDTGWMEDDYQWQCGNACNSLGGSPVGLGAIPLVLLGMLRRRER